MIFKPPYFKLSYFKLSNFKPSDEEEDVKEEEEPETVWERVVERWYQRGTGEEVIPKDESWREIRDGT